MTQWKQFSQAFSSRNDTVLYKDRVVPAKFTRPEKRFRVLFRDIFGHHVQLDSTLRIHGDAELLENDIQRMIEQDEVSAIFREKFLGDFRVSDIDNESPDDVLNNLLDDWRDAREICNPSVVFPYKAQRGHGNNRLSLILGNAGEGKSLLLTKILSDCIVKDRSAFEGHMLAVYINMESSWLKEGEGVFKEIDDSFWDLIFTRLLGQVPRRETTLKLREALTALACDRLLTAEYKLRDACRILPEHGYFAVIVIDNVDRYHFSEVRHSFFKEYAREQVDSIQRNIARIVNKFKDLEALGRISASIAIVCRRPVFDHLMLAVDGSDPNDNRLKGYSVYQLLEPTSSTIVSPRLSTLRHVIDREIAAGRLSQPDKDAVEAAFSILKSATVERGKTDVSNDGLHADVCDLLVDLSHQGPRGVIQFLSEFQFDVRKNAEAIDRVFRTQPRNLLRLYIANGRKRYSQAAQHFPNLFLVDCCADRIPEYALAYLPHRQTYWLKWIALRLLDQAPGGAMSFEELHRLLHTAAGYEDHVVRLVVGSLATPNKAGCIAIRYTNHSIGSRHLSLTKRGAALVREQHTKVLMGIPFCFSFDYLQLVADDPQISFPALWADAVVPPGMSLDYALRERDEYHRRALEYLRRKMPSTLIFLQILESSWLREQPRVARMGEWAAKSVTPNFTRIRESLLGAYGAILSSWPGDKDAVYAELVAKSDELSADGAFARFWEELGD